MTNAPLWFTDQKDPTDVDDWILDFSGALAAPGALSSSTTYDTITGTPTVTATPSDMSVSDIQLATGAGGADTGVGFWLSGGTAGGTYQISVTVKTTGGRTFERSAWLTVATL